MLVYALGIDRRGRGSGTDVGDIQNYSDMFQHKNDDMQGRAWRSLIHELFTSKEDQVEAFDQDACTSQRVTATLHHKAPAKFRVLKTKYIADLNFYLSNYGDIRNGELSDTPKTSMWKCCLLGREDVETAAGKGYIRSELFQDSEARDSTYVKFLTGQNQRGTHSIPKFAFGRIQYFIAYTPENDTEEGGDHLLAYIHEIPTVAVTVQTQLGYKKVLQRMVGVAEQSASKLKIFISVDDIHSLQAVVKSNGHFYFAERHSSLF